MIDISHIKKLFNLKKVSISKEDSESIKYEYRWLGYYKVRIYTGPLIEKGQLEIAVYKQGFMLVFMALYPKNSQGYFNFSVDLKTINQLMLDDVGHVHTNLGQDQAYLLMDLARIFIQDDA